MPWSLCFRKLFDTSVRYNIRKFLPSVSKRKAFSCHSVCFCYKIKSNNTTIRKSPIYFYILSPFLLCKTIQNYKMRPCLLADIWLIWLQNCSKIYLILYILFVKKRSNQSAWINFFAEKTTRCLTLIIFQKYSKIPKCFNYQVQMSKNYKDLWLDRWLVISPIKFSNL